MELIGEQIIKSNLEFKNTRVGWLSSIDYADNRWFSICDDSNKPIRFYKLKLKLDNNSFNLIDIEDVYFLKNEKGKDFTKNTIDGESLRFDLVKNKIVWTSEGNINNNIPPAFYETDIASGVSQIIKLDSSFNNIKNFHHNGTFESLSLSNDNKGYWLASEYPLKKDGNKPSFSTNYSPIRISYINKQTQKCTKQYAYILEKTAIEHKDKKTNGNNGLVEILALNATQFLTLERSYTAGEENVIRLYVSSIEAATTNLINIDSLKKSKFTALKKELLLDFRFIKEQLTSKTIDNIEGMCFGPELKYGSKTLVFISDDNFNKYGNQITQLIAFKFN